MEDFIGVIMRHHLLPGFRWSVFWALLLWIGWPSVGEGAPVDDSEEAGWIEGRIESMSLAQKLGQLLMVGIQGR
jgi:hypothetical protein